MSSCNGVKLSSASDSATQSGNTSSRYLPPYSQRAAPGALTIVLLSIRVYMGAAATELPLSPTSAPRAICAKSSSIGCRKSDERLQNGLREAMKTVVVRVFLPPILITALYPLSTTLTTFDGPVHFSCTKFGSIPCRKKGALAFPRKEITFYGPYSRRRSPRCGSVWLSLCSHGSS